MWYYTFCLAYSRGNLAASLQEGPSALQRQIHSARYIFSRTQGLVVPSVANNPREKMTDPGCDASNKRHPYDTSPEQTWQFVEDVDNSSRKAKRRNSVLGAQKQRLRARSKSSDYQDTRLHYREEAHFLDESWSEDTRSEVTSPSYQK